MRVERILQLLKNYISFVFCLFGIYLGVYVIISHYIFNNYNMPLNYVGYFVLVAFITAAILLIILKMNRINAIVQVLLVYISITISIYFIGFITRSFTSNFTFWTSSLVFNLICLCILLGVIIVKRTLENKKLNETLKQYKERDKQ